MHGGREIANINELSTYTKEFILIMKSTKSANPQCNLFAHVTEIKFMYTHKICPKSFVKQDLNLEFLTVTHELS